MTLKTIKEAPEANSNPTRSPTKQMKKVVSIAPYYREAVASQKVKIPLKHFKNKHVLIVGSPKQAVASEEQIFTSPKRAIASEELLLASFRQTFASSSSLSRKKSNL